MTDLKWLSIKKQWDHVLKESDFLESPSCPSCWLFYNFSSGGHGIAYQIVFQKVISLIENKILVEPHFFAMHFITVIPLLFQSEHILNSPTCI